MSMLAEYIERLGAAWTAYQRGPALTQHQLAAAVRVSWSGPIRYRRTQDGHIPTALANWRRARAVYRRMQSLQEIDSTIELPATATAPSSKPRLVIKRPA